MDYRYNVSGVLKVESQRILVTGGGYCRFIVRQMSFIRIQQGRGRKWR